MKSKFDWRAAYFHLVSLIAIVVFLIAAINAAHGILRMVVPELSLPSYEWQQVESFEAYKRQGGAVGLRTRLREAPPDTVAPAEEQSEDELRADWEDFRRLTIAGERRRGLWDLMQGLMTALVAVPIFWWHRRGANRLKRESDSEE